MEESRRQGDNLMWVREREDLKTIHVFLVLIRGIEGKEGFGLGWWKMVGDRARSKMSGK